MSVEIPYDVINEVRIAVLKETNLSSYNLDDASLPSLPSLETSISELDPSPPRLRCKYCKGRLIRGVDSLICVFCGKQQVQQEAPPQPINFKSTFGCRWLLQSLALDGSEIAGLPVKGNDSDRGQKSAQEEFPLSDFLDLEIKWQPELEKVESNKSPLSFVGVNLDNFVAEGKIDTVSQEQVVEDQNNDDSGNDDFQVRDSFSLFENVQHAEPAVRSVEDESSGGLFDGWEANFQSSGDGNSREESNSFVPVVESSVDLSVHMDAVFGSGKSFGEGKEKNDSSASTTNDWFQDDLWSGSNLQISDESKHGEMTANTKDGGRVENVNNSSSMSSDLIQDDQHKNESHGSPYNEAIHEEDDSFDSWNNFTSSSNISETKQVGVTGKDSGKLEIVNDTNNTSSRSIDLVQEEHLQINNNIERPDNKAIDEEDDSFDAWNDFAGSTSVQETSNGQSGRAKQFEVTTNSKDGEMAENAKISSSIDVDWFQDNQWQTTANKAPDNKTNDVDDDFFDAWNDFTSSSAKETSKSQTGQAKQFETTVDDRIVGNANNSSSIAWIQDDHWPTSSNRTPDSKTINESYDLFDTWNDFTSSTSAQDLANKQTVESKQSEMNANKKDHGIMEVNNSSFDWFQGDQGQTSSNKTPAEKTTNEGHDLLVVWNGFTSSTGAHNPSNKQSINHMAPSVEQPSEIQLTEPHSMLQNDDFGSFSQAHFFSGAFGDQYSSKEVNITKSEPPVSDGVYDVNMNGGGNSAQVGDVSIATTRSTTDDVEKIMSQMHDLSFMLANNLSIPSKSR